MLRTILTHPATITLGSVVAFLLLTALILRASVKQGTADAAKWAKQEMETTAKGSERYAQLEHIANRDPQERERELLRRAIAAYHGWHANAEITDEYMRTSPSALAVRRVLTAVGVLT